MAKKKYEEEDGVWRTIGGRRVFIRNGQSLSDAMKESGKFKKASDVKRGEYQDLKASVDYQNAINERKNLSKKMWTGKSDEEDNKIYDNYVKAGEKEKELYRYNADRTNSGSFEAYTGDMTNEVWAGKHVEGGPNSYKEKTEKDYSKLSNNEVYEEAWKLRDKTKDYNLKNEIDKRLDRIDRANRKGEGYAEKPTNELREILKNNNNDTFEVDNQRRIDDGKEIHETFRQMTDKEMKEFSKQQPDSIKKMQEYLKDNQKQEGIRLNQKAQNGVRDDIKAFLSGKEDYDGSREDFINDLSNEWGVDRDKVEDILHEESSKHPRLFKTERPKAVQDVIDGLSVDKGFTQNVDMTGDVRLYNQNELKQMEEQGIKPMKNSYTGGGWEGVNAHKNLSTKEQAKAITDAMKEKYPDVKISRKTDIYSGGSSIDFNIMESAKDMYISNNDIDNMTDFGRLSVGIGFENWAEKNVEGFKRYTNETYTTNDVRKYAKEVLNNIKTHEDQNVRGDEWYLSSYGKEVVSSLNKEANSYTYSDSDGMVDYFNHGTYMHINIGKWDKPYQVSTSKQVKDAYEKYIKEHKNTNVSIEEFKKWYK